MITHSLTDEKSLSNINQPDHIYKCNQLAEEKLRLNTSPLNFKNVQKEKKKKLLLEQRSSDSFQDTFKDWEKDKML